MKFSLVASVLAATAAASPSLVERNPTLVERDIATFTSVLASIQSSVNTLNSAIQAYNGGIPVQVEQDNDSLVTTINNGASTIQGQPDLSEGDSLTLVTPVESLSAAVTTTINNLIAKKSIVDAACLGQIVLTDLNNEKTAATALANAIVSKVPGTLQPTAQSLAAGITNAIQKGIDAYANPPACSSSGGSGPTSSGSSSGSSSSTDSGSSPATTTTGTDSSSSSTTTSTGVVVPPVSSSTPSVTPISSSQGGSSPSTTGVTPISSNAAALSGVSAPVALAALAAVFAF